MKQSRAGGYFAMSDLVAIFLAAAFIAGDLLPFAGSCRLDDRVIPEASGIVKSRRHPGIFWVHNDSGNPPLLFAIKDDGRIVRQFRLGIPNIDWEDIATDDRGHLYVGDIGNNLGILPLRTIYRLDEPDPNAFAEKVIAASISAVYTMPKGRRFDAESLFLDRGKAMILAKYLDGREAELFSIALDPPSSLLRPTQPRLVGKMSGFTEPATGADLNKDGTLLAVCATAVTRVYRRDDRESPPWRLLAVVRYRPLSVEGVAWDGLDLRLVAEGGGFYRVAEKTWRASPGKESLIVPARPPRRPEALPSKERDGK
jgi:hypothetical protein